MCTARALPGPQYVPSKQTICHLHPRAEGESVLMGGEGEARKLLLLKKSSNKGKVVVLCVIFVRRRL